MLPILKNHGLRCVRPGESFGSLTRLLDDFLPDIQPWRHVGNLDVFEDDKNLYVEAELPGMSKDQIELTLEDGILHLKAEQKDDGVLHGASPQFVLMYSYLPLFSVAMASRTDGNGVTKS